MKQTTIDLIKKIAEEQGFVVTISDEEIMFSKFSPAGQDFNVSIDTIKDTDLSRNDVCLEIGEMLYQEYIEFDVSYETYLWLDNTGHGKNGAPDDMVDVYNDMKGCEEYIYELSEAFKNA